VIKCVGCYDLLREELELEGKHLVVYNCPRFFPYLCSLRGLIYPGKGIIKAARDCPERIDRHCILCAKTDAVRLFRYGEEMVFMCKDHGQDWREWLDEHPERFAHIAPKGRLNRSNWIEVFREFIEDMRLKGNPII